MHFGPVFATAFLASSVEAVEAATVVLAAGITRGWRSASVGAAAAAAVLVAIVALAGPAIGRLPVTLLQAATGTLLLLFGVRWLRKSMLRYAGAIPLRDENAVFERERASFGASSRPRLDLLTALAVFKVVCLEGIEVIVIVLGFAAGGNQLIPASAGAVAACMVVALAGVIAHRPLARVPENALKLAVGVMVCAFGLFWFGEGVGVRWPYGDATILVLIAAMLATAGIGVRVAQRQIS